MKNNAFFILSIIYLFSCSDQRALLETPTAKLQWKQTAEGWRITEIATRDSAGAWAGFGQPDGQYTFLFSPEKPLDSTQHIIRDNQGKPFPGPEFRYIIQSFQYVTGPVFTNTAGQAVSFFPSQMTQSGDSLVFRHETEQAEIVASWIKAPDNQADVLILMRLTAKQAGWFSLASPSVAALAEADLGWGLVPGYFQGNALQPDTVLAVAYAQGLPNFPYICGDRTVSTPAAILQNKANTTLSVILEPGQTRDPWAVDGNENTHRQSRTGFSHMSRSGQLSPTVYAPLLNHPDAQLAAGQTLTATFRLHLGTNGWFAALQHTMDDVYQTTATLSLKKNTQSLSKRVERLLAYSLDDQTSFWQEATFEGKKLGAQLYMGGVVGSDKDAVKNSDIGAMWMMSQLTGNQELASRRLPLVRNFKLLQQEPAEGFFKGAARGQYYLTKGRRWVEEWGSHIEPTGVTYYTLADLGNILLFKPEDAELKTAFRQGADRLLEWQRPDGSWVIGYDHQTNEPVYTDLQDFRPTFYGLMMAYRILGDDKYLAAAKKGADWIVENAVKPGHFVGVCGDVRFVNDFATAQISQALLDLWEMTSEEKYKEAGIETAKMYVFSIYSHPVPDTHTRQVKGKTLQGWQFTQAGLSFEHGGSIGSAAGTGPILLASHAGLFVRVAQLTGNQLFATLARSAAWGRDAFVNPETSVASYYWARMDAGSGPFPHHAWWQIGWLMDYLVAEADYRSNGQIRFPAGFMTAKVGPHKPYGFANGTILGDSVALMFRPEAVQGLPPSVDWLMAKSTDGKSAYIVLMQNDTQGAQLSVQFDAAKLLGKAPAQFSIWDAQTRQWQPITLTEGRWEGQMNDLGWAVLKATN